MAGGLHFTLNFRKLSKSSNALKSWLFHQRSLLFKLSIYNRHDEKHNQMRKCHQSFFLCRDHRPHLTQTAGSGAPRPAVPSRGCQEEVSWGRDCEAGKNKALKPREICQVIITVGHNLHLLLKQPISFQNQQKTQLQGLFLFQQGPEETADGTLQSGDRHSGMKIISQENLRENMGQIQTLYESIPQPRCSTTKAILHNNSRLP